MKRIRSKYFIFLLTALLLSFTCSIFSHAETATVIEASIRGNLSMVKTTSAIAHAEPNYSSARTGTIEKDSYVLCLDTSSIWTKITYFTREKAVTGWILTSYLERHAPQPGTKYIINTPLLNMRTGPGVQYDILCNLHFNDIVSQISTYKNQIYETESWTMISIGGSYGWVSKQYLQKYDGHLLRHTTEITANNITVTGQKNSFSVDVNYTCNSDGEVILKSGSDSVSVISAHQVRISGKYEGTTYLTIKVPQTETYTAAEKTITLTVEPRELEDPALTVKNAKLRSDSELITYQLQYSCRSNGRITMTSDSSSVKVTSGGELIILPDYVGTATITVKVDATDDYKADTKQAVITVRPLRPVSFSAKVTSTGKKIKVTWKKAERSKKVYIYVSKTKDFRNIVKKKAVSTKNKSCVIKGLPKGTYYVKACGVTNKVKSIWTKTIRVKIK